MGLCRMKGRKIKEKEGSAIVMYIRSTSDILPKWKDIRNSYIPPIWNDMRNIADISKLSEIGGKEHIDFNREVKL